jgi:hypothetical protein
MLVVFVILLWYLWRRTYSIDVNIFGVRAGQGIVLDRCKGKVTKDSDGSLYMKLWGWSRRKENIPVEDYSQLVQTIFRAKGSIFMIKFAECDYKILDIQKDFSDFKFEPSDVNLKNLHVESQRRLINRHVLNSFWKQYEAPIIIFTAIFIFLIIEYVMFKDVNANLAVLNQQIGNTGQKMGEFTDKIGQYITAIGS